MCNGKIIFSSLFPQNHLKQTALILSNLYPCIFCKNILLKPNQAYHIHYKKEKEEKRRLVWRKGYHFFTKLNKIKQNPIVFSNNLKIMSVFTIFSSFFHLYLSKISIVTYYLLYKPNSYFLFIEVSESMFDILAIA